MNFNTLTKEFKIYIGIFAFVNVYVMSLAYLTWEPVTVAIMTLVPLIGALIVALRDEKSRVDGVTGWWALAGCLWSHLSIIYPIAVSIKERKFNSVLWFVLLAYIVPIFLFVLAAIGLDVLFGIEMPE